MHHMQKGPLGRRSCVHGKHTSDAATFPEISMLDKLDAEFAFGRQALDVRSYRQELLSSNIANADTPGYKARDVDFASTLAGALRKNGGTTTGTGASNGSTL